MNMLRTFTCLVAIVATLAVCAQQDGSHLNVAPASETQVMLVLCSLKDQTIWVTGHDRTTRTIQTGKSIEDHSLGLLDVLQQLHREGWRISAVSAEGIDGDYRHVGKTTYVLIREKP